MSIPEPPGDVNKRPSFRKDGILKLLSDGAQSVLQQARVEALHLNHDYIGTEHLLLGLIQESSGDALNMLMDAGISTEKIKDELMNLIIPGESNAREITQIRSTRYASRVLAFAADESQLLGQQRVNTEHILLGLLHGHEDLGGQVLEKMGLKLDPMRELLMKLRK